MQRIEEYALIGDLQSAALVGRDGSIDWCCFPRFDSDACFAALLGGPEHGRWLVAPTVPVRTTRRRYRPNTLILETVVETADGAIRMIDFMPPRGIEPDIVRIVEGLDGTVAMRSELVIRFGYGATVPWVRRLDGARLAIAGPDALCFRSPIESEGRDLRTLTEFAVRVGERIPFVVTWFPSHTEVPPPIDAEAALDETERYWLEWAAQCDHQGDYHEEIHQSLLVLRALTYAPTGGIVAAPTTSLPEHIGGVRNWDYRYCWLRDAAMTLVAMLNAGYLSEALAWRHWLLRAVAGDPADIQILYGIAGERRITEWSVEWLPGYERSSPVRVGNAASAQLQLDVYGTVVDALYAARAAGASDDDNVWALTLAIVAWLEEHWRLPDAGIWEVRGPQRHFTHSKIMAWVGFDRAIRTAEEFGRGGPVGRWRELRDEIHGEVLDRGWSPARGAFTQSYDSHELDASLLLIPIVGFLPASDERVASTVEAIRRELTHDGLVLRYRTDQDTDGLPPGEGVFLPCSFWLVHVLALQGKAHEARELFEMLLDIRNDVGLLAEEFDPVSRRQLGNFPQALTHLSLVNAALALESVPAHPVSVAGR